MVIRASPTLLLALLAFHLISNVGAFTAVSPSLVAPQSQRTCITIAPGSRMDSCSTSLGLMGFGRSQENTFRIEKKSNCLFGTKNRQNDNIIHRKRLAVASMIPSIVRKLRRTLTIIMASATLLLGPVSHPPMAPRLVAHASTTTLTINSKSQQTLDKLINDYVQRHMFDDDKFDPLESTYREIISDSSTGAYPNALSSVASNLGATQTTSSTISSSSTDKESSNDGIMKYMLKLVNTLETKYNIPRSILMPAIVLTCFGVPSFVIFMGLLSFSFAQRGMTERMAIERYGESVLDAEEMPVEEEEDDDYDYETGEYEEDEDDEDDVS